jgi:hypothetical protein
LNPPTPAAQKDGKPKDGYPEGVMIENGYKYFANFGLKAELLRGEFAII